MIAIKGEKKDFILDEQDAKIDYDYFCSSLVYIETEMKDFLDYIGFSRNAYLNWKKSKKIPIYIARTIELLMRNKNLIQENRKDLMSVEKRELFCKKIEDIIENDPSFALLKLYRQVGNYSIIAQSMKRSRQNVHELINKRIALLQHFAFKDGIEIDIKETFFSDKMKEETIQKNIKALKLNLFEQLLFIADEYKIFTVEIAQNAISEYFGNINEKKIKAAINALIAKGELVVYERRKYCNVEYIENIANQFDCTLATYIESYCIKNNLFFPTIIFLKALLKNELKMDVSELSNGVLKYILIKSNKFVANKKGILLSCADMEDIPTRGDMLHEILSENTQGMSLKEISHAFKRKGIIQMRENLYFLLKNYKKIDNKYYLPNSYLQK